MKEKIHISWQANNLEDIQDVTDFFKLTLTFLCFEKGRIFVAKIANAHAANMKSKSVLLTCIDCPHTNQYGGYLKSIPIHTGVFLFSHLFGRVCSPRTLYTDNLNGFHWPHKSKLISKCSLPKQQFVTQHSPATFHRQRRASPTLNQKWNIWPIFPFYFFCWHPPSNTRESNLGGAH